ncbi:MAG: hypothetical protein U1E37_01070 [Sphingomonadaceae bacterium]|mgnify:CR=1 FL=1
MRNLFVKLWLLGGTLDALYATMLTLLRGNGDIVALWSGVAAGPFGDAARGWGAAGLVAGLAVHFAIMAAMVAGGIWLARKTMLGDLAPWKSGTFYGLMLYCFMYGVVLNLRFAVPFPNPDKVKLLLGLFPHVFFVGMPIFHFARKTPRPS